MSWTCDDVKQWKDKWEKFLGKKIQSEKGLYPFLVTWIKNKHPRSKVFFERPQSIIFSTSEAYARFTSPFTFIYLSQQCRSVVSAVLFYEAKRQK